MNQKQLAETIGTSERTLRRMSPRKRQQWAALAAKGRSIAWFDVLAQLMFEVEAFNAGRQSSEWIWMQISAAYVSVARFNHGTAQKCFEVYNIEELTEALQYVQGLNK